MPALSTLIYILATPFSLSPVMESGQGLTAGPVSLHPNGDTSKCLDVRLSVFANGTPVQMYVAVSTPLCIPRFDGSLFPGFFFLTSVWQQLRL